MEDSAVYIMDGIISSLPDNRPDGFGFIVSVAFAQDLYNSVYNVFSGKIMIAKVNDEFTWMGVKCIVR